MNLNENLKIYMQTIRLMDESTDDYLYLYDLVNDRLYFTDKIRRKYPLPPGENGLPISQWAKIVYARDFQQLDQNLSEIRQGNSENHDMEYRLLDREGNRVWVNCRGTVQKDQEGNPILLVGCVSELAMGRMVDSLTGLWNSDKFMEDMGKNLEENNGYLMVLGIDNFKSINVKNGRTFGNSLLKNITEVLEDHADSVMRLYRLDGDRFAVNFVKKNKKDVLDFYHSIKKELEGHCTVSAGVVDYSSDDEKDSGSLYQYAESAMDRAKREGKDMLIFFSSEDYQKSLEQIRFQDELKAAVKDGCRGFYLCYQPQIDSRSFSLYGAEALLRYESPVKGLVSPVEFIPVLEQSGQICQVGLWVLKTAVEQCIRWRRSLPDFHINVNISYVQLRQEGIDQLVLDVLREAGLPGNALTLEVTESMQLQDYSYFNRIFYEWKRHGIKIAIDDFGTGYSSLSYLKSIDVDETKIDRCFVNRIHCNAYNYRLLSNMIELAHGARIQVCCEGVETEEELMALQELGTDVLQGFLFAKPYKTEEFEKVYIHQDSQEYQERLKKESDFLLIDSTDNRVALQELKKDEIVNIVESMDEVIYVSDVDTHELYYMNAEARKLTGIYDYKGRKCYQVLQGRNKPCEFCTNQTLNEDTFCEWYTKNEFFGREFVLKDKLIPWLGKMARLEIAIDTGRKDFAAKNRLNTENSPGSNRLPEEASRKILNKVELGLWVIRIDEENSRYEMYTDEVMNRIMGLQKPLPPEECYAYWYNRINEGYYNYVNLAVESIIRSGKTNQVEYTWNHPDKGQVTVRCTGVRVEDKNGLPCIEGYHRIVSDLERPYFLPGGLNSEIFEYNEKRHTVYFHTDRKLIFGENTKEQDFPECWIREQVVHPDFQEKFREIFHDVRNKEDNRTSELLLRTKEGAYERFKLKTRRLGSKEQDAHTIVVLLDSANEEPGTEIEQM